MRIAVVGGGIAGLAAAQRLRELALGQGQAVEVVLIDRASRLGGKLRTGEIAGRSVETGAEMFLARERGGDSAVVELARAVGLGTDLIHPASVPAAIAIGGALHRVPAGTLLGIPSDPSTLDGLACAADLDHDAGRPILAAGEDVAVGALVRRRLGDEVVDRLVEPMLGGVYAGRADRLSLAATMPGLLAAAQRERTLTGAVRTALEESARPPGAPVFATVRGGLGRLVAAVAAAAAADVRLGATVRELARTGPGWHLVLGSTRDLQALDADGVVLAVPAHPASRLLRGVDGRASELVGALDYASVALVTLALPPEVDLPALSGFLVPPAEGFAVKAVTFVTTKWPDLHRDGAPVLVRLSFGRYCDERVLQRLDEDLIRVARADLERLVGGAVRGRDRLPEPTAAMVSRWGGGLPQYGVGHVERTAQVRTQLPATLGVAGSAYDGVGLAACVRSGQAAADQVWAGLRESRV